MASEAITRNDLTAILNEVLPPTPSEYRKLLWTNPSPSSSFAAQTVSLDLSDYDEVEVICRSYATTADYFTSRCKVNDGNGMLFSQTGSGSPVRIYGTQRKFTPTSTGVVFDNGLDFSASTSNVYCVPCQIYGISYDRVAPPQSDEPEALTVTLNSTGLNSGSWLRAYKIGHLVCVTGIINAKAAGVALTLASVEDAPAICETWSIIGGYGNIASELYISANSTSVIFNLGNASIDYKVNFCYITTA